LDALEEHRDLLLEEWNFRNLVSHTSNTFYTCKIFTGNKEEPLNG
jgi:hypothetical protein